MISHLKGFQPKKTTVLPQNCCGHSTVGEKYIIFFHFHGCCHFKIKIQMRELAGDSPFPDSRSTTIIVMVNRVRPDHIFFFFFLDFQNSHHKKVWQLNTNIEPNITMSKHHILSTKLVEFLKSRGVFFFKCLKKIVSSYCSLMTEIALAPWCAASGLKMEVKFEISVKFCTCEWIFSMFYGVSNRNGMA